MPKINYHLEFDYYEDAIFSNQFLINLMLQTTLTASGHVFLLRELLNLLFICNASQWQAKILEAETLLYSIACNDDYFGFILASEHSHYCLLPLSKHSLEN